MVNTLKITALALTALGVIFVALYYFAGLEIGRLATVCFLAAIGINLYRHRSLKRGRPNSHS